ncbi:MAG: PaaI family thioesterase [Solirubrobacteraceae bacterium]
MDGFAGELGVRDESAEDGRARLRFEVAETHLNPAGTLHGGVLATLVDTAWGWRRAAALATMRSPRRAAFARLLTAGRLGGLEVTAQVRKQGEHLLVCAAEVEQEGRTLVHAVATFALLQG